MRILSIIQPSEMGSDFRFDEEAGLWKVNFPAGMGEGGGVPLSTDNNNAIGLGSDEGAFISTDLLGAYALTQDNGSKKINLYRFQPGTEFNPETATLVSSVNMIELSGIFDDVAIDGDLITFTDADTGLTLTIDTANLQKVSDITGSDSVEVNSLNGVTTLSVKINPHPDNLIEVTEEGLFVDAANFGEGGGDLDLHQTLAQVEDGLCHVVGSSHLVVPQIELVDVAGNAIGYINDIIGLPVSSQTHGPDHCPKWEAPTANNCRVGKVAVALDPDLMYGFNPGDSSIEWRVFFNGVDTGYIAAASELAPPSEVDQPMLMSLTQEDFGDATDFIGKGYLEEIISNATNGVISGSYDDNLTLLNETNQQVILTLVPSKPISLDAIRNVYNAGESSGIFGLTLDEVIAFRSEGLDTPLTAEKLEDYFDEETGVLSICLAPNASGNGGSTGPQISCAGATDRFATSGLWYNWTVKINGQTVITNGNSGDVVQAMEQHGIRVNYNGEMETTYRNMTSNDIRIEMIATLPENYWERNYLEIDTSTNPTLMGYDPLQNNAEVAMMSLAPMALDEPPPQYQRITVCLTPANDWMNWDYKNLDTSTAEITLTNSVNLTDAVQNFSVEGEPDLNVTTGVNKWGDLTWTIHANQPLRTNVKLIIEHPNYTDQFNYDFFARKPMVLTLANPHEYARETSIVSSLDAESVKIVSVEVVGGTGSTVINNPEDGMLVDAVHGSVRFDDLADGKFSYIVQGRQFATGISDIIKVKFVTDLGVEEVVEHTFRADDIDGFLPIYPNQHSKVTVGLVDNNRYNDLRDLPAITVDSPEWDYQTMNRVNGVGGEVVMELDFAQQPTYQLKINADLNGAELAVLGSCVVGVDDWGDLGAGGYTFNSEAYNGRFEAEAIDFTNISKNNLTYVPKGGPSNLQNMTGMFAGTDLSDPSVDLSGYDVRNVYSMAGVFAHSNFNGDILSWDTRWVGNLDYAFYASKFRQDLSLWCVSSIGQEPKLFSHRAPLLAKHKPVWGTCPLQDNTSNMSLRNSAGYGSEITKASFPNDYSRDNPAVYGSKYISLTCYKPLLLIGDRAFKDQLINKVSFIPNLKQIGKEAFMNNQLETVTIYGGITKIDDSAFAGNPLRFVGVIENTPPVLGVDAIPTNVEGIYVPDSAVAKYKSANGWSNYAEVIKPLSTAPGIVYTVMYDETQPEIKHTLYFINTVVPEDFLENSKVTINSINEGVTTVGSDGLFGNKANYLKIPSSLTTVNGAGLNLSADILEFSEGFTTNEFMLSSRPSASTLILPSTTTALKGIFVSAFPNVVVCKAMVPPTIESSQYTHALNRYRNAVMRAVVVPAAAMDAYRADPSWKDLSANFVPLEDFTYGNVLDVTRVRGSGEISVRGNASVADAGKEVTISYSDYRYNSQLGVNVRSDITYHTTTVGADGYFELAIPDNSAFATHYVSAYIGYGNEKVAPW